MRSKRRKLPGFILFGGTVLLGLALSFPASDAIHVLSTNEFCVSCHTMKAVGETFAMSPHGGNNSQGFVANCVDCHLPKSNALHEFWVKGTDGTRHVFMEYVMGMTALDYDEVHPKRAEYTYESACLACHKLIPAGARDATVDSSVRDKIHATVLKNRERDDAFHCAGCHYDVSHPGLRRVMQEKYYQALAAHANK